MSVCHSPATCNTTLQQRRLASSAVAVRKTGSQHFLLPLLFINNIIYCFMLFMWIGVIELNEFMQRASWSNHTHTPNKQHFPSCTSQSFNGGKQGGSQVKSNAPRCKLKAAERLNGVCCTQTIRWQRGQWVVSVTALVERPCPAILLPQHVISFFLFSISCSLFLPYSFGSIKWLSNSSCGKLRKMPH